MTAAEHDEDVFHTYDSIDLLDWGYTFPLPHGWDVVDVLNDDQQGIPTDATPAPAG
jgi:hypothetical protein